MEFRKILERATLLTADGMPLVWEMRRKIGKGERVYGPDLMKKMLILSDFGNKFGNFFIGDEKNRKYFEKYGEYITLPYKDKFKESEYYMMVKKIKKDSPKFVWLGLGAEKQIEVANNLSKLLPKCIFITVGAAFDFLSGNKKQAPKGIQKIGFEWLFRLINEPKRLGKRYLKCALFLLRYYGRELIKF
jgi:N-acetylglucosaminyldiphosphoundecaprenol N-acetyl-beta-D-mannosaminyltransferase